MEENLELGDYDSEQEAAYAYNVAVVLLAPLEGRAPKLSELNTHLELTNAQILNVETTVCKIIRGKAGLPKNYKFPDVIKQFLKQTYTEA